MEIKSLEEETEGKGKRELHMAFSGVVYNRSHQTIALKPNTAH